MVSQDSTCTAAREASSAAASYNRKQRATACGVRHNFQTDIQWSGNKITILWQSEHQKIPPHPKHPRLKKHFFCSRNPMFLPAATINTKCDISDMPSMQPQKNYAPPRRDRGCQSTCLYIHLRTSAVVFCYAIIGEWRSPSLEYLCWKGRGGSHRLGPC